MDSPDFTRTRPEATHEVEMGAWLVCGSPLLTNAGEFEFYIKFYDT